MKSGMLVHGPNGLVQHQFGPLTQKEAFLRMPNERRKDARYNLSLPVKCDGMSGFHETRIEDISLGGCFINSPSRVDVGEPLSLQLRLPSGEWLPLSGNVTAFQPGIGFGMEFTHLTDDQTTALRKLLS